MKVQLFKGKGSHRWFLRLVAHNGEVLAHSEGYYSKWNAQRAARKNFSNVPLVILD